MEDKLLINLLEKRKVFWEPIVAAALLLVAILGTMVPLYIHSDSRCTQQIEAIRQDMKGFHEAMQTHREESRKEAQEFRSILAQQDREFRERLLKIEMERNAK